MVHEHIDTFLHLLGQFTGTGGGARHPIVQFGLAAIFWGVLLMLARVRYRRGHEPRELWLMWGFSFGLARELFMVLVKVAEAYGWVEPDALHVVFPPAEHALSNIALVIVAAAFIRFLTQHPQVAWRYLLFGVGAIITCYLVTFWWWAEFITANPTSKFGQTWCDWAFRITASGLLGFAVVFLWTRVDGWARNVVCAALTLFFLNEFLKLPDMALGERYEHYFAPVRHALYIAAIPLLGYVYAKELALELARSVDTLESRVEERTRALSDALAQLQDVNERLTELAQTDSLTGLANRRSFNERLAAHWQHSLRTGRPLAVVLVDVDHFKAINDNYGHAMGDEVLVKLARVVAAQAARPVDVAARYGGDEFIVLLPETDVAGASALSERIRSNAERLLVAHNGNALPVTVSIGAASVVAHEDLGPSALIEMADANVYRAKTQGRNRVTPPPTESDEQG